MLPIILNTLFTKHRQDMAKANEKARGHRRFKLKPPAAEGAQAQQADKAATPDGKSEKV